MRRTRNAAHLGSLRLSRYPACRVRGRGIDDATQAAAQGAAGLDAPGTALRAEHISASAASMLGFGVLCPQLARADAPAASLS
jgi:hypothetical protein